MTSSISTAPWSSAASHDQPFHPDTHREEKHNAPWRIREMNTTDLRDRWTHEDKILFPNQQPSAEEMPHSWQILHWIYTSEQAWS